MVIQNVYSKNESRLKLFLLNLRWISSFSRLGIDIGLMLSQKTERRLAMRKRINKVIGVALLAGLLAALTIPAAAQSVTRTLTFSRQAKVGSQTIQPGKYSIVYDETKDGDLVVLKDGKEVLKAAYKRTELASQPADSAVIFIAGDGGGYKVKRIEIKGSKTALVFE
jgi:hypothetical protein